MADRVSFCVNEVVCFQQGVAIANSEMSNVASDLNFESSRVAQKAECIFQKIETILSLMNEDRNIAHDVREYNQQTLLKYKQRLDELRQRYDELSKEYSRAYDLYRKACEEETRIHYTSVPSSGDSEIDKQNREAHAKALDAAHKLVRETDHQCHLIKEEQARVQRNIEITLYNIKITEETIEKLTKFITDIQYECDRVERYRNRLKNDVKELHSKEKRFSSVKYESEKLLDTCLKKAGRAIECGRKICTLLDPDNDVNDHDNCQINFSDLKALDRISNSLLHNCEQYEDASDLLQERVGVRENVMQDNVISEGAMYINDVRDSCARQINAMRRTARNCKEASRDLKEYANLMN